MTSCPICLEECDHSFIMPCGHPMHHSCAIQNAWNGNIGCPTCRAIPLGINKDEAEDTRENIILSWQTDQINNLCRNAIRSVQNNAKNISKTTKNAVLAFHRLKKRIQNEKAKELEDKRNFTRMTKKFRSDINTLAPSYKKKFSINIKSFINIRTYYHYRCWSKFSNKQRRYKSQIDNAKKNIAKSMGFQTLL